jgi:hypothetical protein
LFRVFVVASESLNVATVNAGLTGAAYAAGLEVLRLEAPDSTRKPMDAQRIAVDAVVALTDCDRDAAVAFIRRLYLSGVKDPKRLTFKGLQAMARS